jgi:hypothetical protein
MLPTYFFDSLNYDAANCSARHAGCYRPSRRLRPSCPHHLSAASAPRSAVAELAVVMRHYVSSLMNAAKVILRTAAFLIGAVASYGVAVGACREFHGGPTGVVPILMLVPAIIAGVLILISWRREFVRAPAVVPSAVFAACAFFYYVSLPDRIGLYEFGTGRDSSWFTFLLSLLTYFVFISFLGVVAAFVYHGTHAFLSSLGHVFSRNNRKA